MNELLGFAYSSVWLAVLFLVGYCLIMTVLDRLMGNLAGKISGKERTAKLAHFVLDSLCSCAVLVLLDKVLSGVSLAWVSLVVLALATAAVMVYSGNGN